jgi:hypothetical protein
MAKQQTRSRKKSGKQSPASIEAESKEVEAILARLETGIARERDAMGELLRLLRATRYIRDHASQRSSTST